MERPFTKQSGFPGNLVEAKRAGITIAAVMSGPLSEK
jgi:hypothetical protein